jgi:hypothetical protein
MRSDVAPQAAGKWSRAVGLAVLRDESEGLQRGAGQVAQRRRPSRIQGGGVHGWGKAAEPRVRSGPPSARAGTGACG